MATAKLTSQALYSWTTPSPGNRVLQGSTPASLFPRSEPRISSALASQPLGGGGGGGGVVHHRWQGPVPRLQISRSQKMLILCSRDPPRGIRNVNSTSWQHSSQPHHDEPRWAGLSRHGGCSVGWPQLSKPFQFFTLKNVYPFCPLLSSCEHPFSFASCAPSLSFVLIPSHPLFVGAGQPRLPWLLQLLPSSQATARRPLAAGELLQEPRSGR